MALPDYQSGNGPQAGFRGLPQPQKTAVIILGILAVAILAFWIWLMRTQIRDPFVLEGGSETAPASTSELNADLRNRDTDRDGLSDYDEIYTYTTSPYLEDSDSDGLSDKDEVASGNNPNCPTGKDCTTPIASPAAATSTPVQATGTPTGLMDEAELQRILSGEIDGATLRQLLISTGAATAEDLAPISDEDLLKSYQEALKNQSSE